MDNMGMTEALRLELVNAIQAMEQAVIDGDFQTFKKNREIKHFLMFDILPDFGSIEDTISNNRTL
jgi:hypothetical protein|tara:strand:+ start:283 stop:477 length:195 start_codon:yes stop_codon:yes gene_type:complete